MKRIVLLEFLVLSLVFASIQVNGAGSMEIIAFSLGRAEQMAVVDHDHLSRGCTLGMTDVIGFIMDPSGDIIIVGRKRPHQDEFSLGADEICQLLRAAAIGGMTGPGVSLEPDPISKDLFQAIYYGGVGSNWIGAQSYSADLLMKEIALGVKPSGLAEMPTYADRMVRLMNVDTKGRWTVLSRIWFVPAYMPMVHDESLWLLARAEVAVLIQNLSAEIDGQAQTNYEDKPAQQYASEFMRRLPEMAAKHEEFSRMQAMMGGLQTAAVLLQQCPTGKLDYWLKNYRPLSQQCPQTAPVLRRQIQTDWGHVEVHGGVRAAGLALRLAHKDLGALKEVILNARPTDKRVIAWRVAFDDHFIPATDELKPSEVTAAKLYVEASRLREERNFDEAALKFQAVADAVPEAIEARFLAAVCRREFLVASARVNELGQPVEELRALVVEYPNLPEVKYEWAVSLCLIGRDADAVPVLQSIVDQVPDYLSALYELGMSEYRLGQKEKATSNLFQYLQMAAGSPWSFEARRTLLEMAAPSVVEKPVLYENGFFSVCRPSNWEALSGAKASSLLSATAGSQNIEVAFVLPRQPACNAVITVQQFPVDHLTRDQVLGSLSQIEQNHRSKCKDYRQIEAGPVEVNGVVGVRFVFTSTQLGVTCKQCVTTLASRFQCVTITCTAPEAEFDSLWQEDFAPINDIHFTTLPLK